MINIISKSYYYKFISGPQKVARNLVKGLDLIHYPYVLNRQLNACKRLWIQDDLLALKQINRLNSDIKIILGPHLAITPRDLPPSLDLSRVVYLQPSRWTKALWEDFDFHACPIEPWPVGIDSDKFAPQHGAKDIVLIYFKQRLPKELDYVEQLLNHKRIPYEKLFYPNYKEKLYKELLARTRYIVWIGCHESQGIALQEAMACNIPILVWDVVRLGHRLVSEKERLSVFTEEENSFTKAAAAEYFDDTCGIKIKNPQEISASLDRMESEWRTFQPRQYILKNLNIENQARDFVEIYNKHFGLTFEQGLNERILRRGSWLNRSIAARLYFLARDIRKMLMRTTQRF